MTKDKLQDLRGRMGRTTDRLQEELAQAALNDLALQLEMQNQMTGYQLEMPEFKGGKTGIPKMSALSNIIPNAIGGLASAYQYFDAAGQDIKAPDVYAGNPYASSALSNLAGIKINPYSTMREMYDAERRNMYAMNRTGGLTGGLKYAAQVAAGIGTLQNIAKVLNSIQAQNNAYKQEYNKALLQTGESIAQRRQNANQFNEEMIARAHAAKQQLMLMGMRNAMDYLNNYAANEYKRKMGNAMLGLYQEDVDLQKATLEYLMNQATGNRNVQLEKPVSKYTYFPKITIPELKLFPSNFGSSVYTPATLNPPTEPYYIPGTRIKNKRYSFK